MAFFPVMAQASSPGSVYEPEVPSVPSEKPPKKNNSIDDPKAGASKNNTDNGGATAPDASPDGEDDENSGVAGGGQGSGDGGSGDGNTGKDGGTGQGNPGEGANADSKPAVGQGTQVSHAQPADGGSSSPLVPILIAVAALAAISVGAVVVRNRRQGGGSDAGVSPRAS